MYECSVSLTIVVDTGHYDYGAELELVLESFAQQVMDQLLSTLISSVASSTVALFSSRHRVSPAQVHTASDKVLGQDVNCIIGMTKLGPL